VVTDELGGIKPREGFVRFSTQAIDQEWIFAHSNGTRYFIVRTSTQLLASTGESNFTVFIATVDRNVQTAAAQLGDRWFFGNTTDILKYWDGSAVVTTSQSIRPAMLASHKARLWAAGIGSDERTIYGSEYLQGHNFALALDPVETDPVRIPVQGALDEVITALYASFNDMLMWFKPAAFGGIHGSRRSNFGSRSYSETVGSAYPTSIQDCDGELRFLGSRRRVFAFGGNAAGEPVLRKISEDIDTLMDTVLQGDLTQRTWTQTSQGEWALGSGGNPNMGLSTNTVAGDVAFVAQATIAVPADGFDDSSYLSSPAWNVVNGSFGVVNGDLQLLSLPAGLADINLPSNFSTGTWTISGTNLGTGFYDFMNSQADLSGEGYQFYYDAGGTLGLRYRRPIGFGPTIAASVAFAVVAPLKKISVTRTEKGIFISSYSDNNVTDLPLTGIPGVAIDTVTSYSNYFSLQPDDGSGFSLDYVQVSSPAYIFYSSFTSQSFNTGTDASAWGNFTANSTENGGTITYGIFSDSDTTLNISDQTTFIASQTIVPDTTPTLRISSYVTVAAYFNRRFSTNTVSMNDFVVRWKQGSTLDVPSAWINQRFWLGVAVGSAANNSVLVFDRNREWNLYTGINMTAAAIYDSSLFFGNAAGLWEAEIGTSDNGAAITAYYKTKAFAPAGLNTKTTFRDLFMTTTESAATLETDYFINGISAAYSLADYAMDGVSGYQDFRIPFATTDIEQGKTIAFRWTITSDLAWQILWANLYHEPDTIMTDN